MDDATEPTTAGSASSARGERAAAPGGGGAAPDGSDAAAPEDDARDDTTVDVDVVAAAKVRGELVAAVERLGAIDLSTWDAQQLTEHLEELAEPIRRLQAHRSIVMASTVENRVRSVPEPRQERARRQVERDLGEQQGLTVGEARRAGAAGRAAQTLSGPGQAFRDGVLSERHVERIARTLEQIPEARRADVERELLELAGRLDAFALGREARAIERREAPVDAERRARFEQARRHLHVTDNDDGGIDLRGTLSGLAAEQVRVALDAFRSFDGDGDRRSAEQRSADALSTMAEVALRSGDAGTNRNVRPHVIVIAEADQLRDVHGVGRFAFSGEPVGWSELGGVLGDCALTGLIRDAQGASIFVSESVRTVPVGLMKALIARDRGCAWSGCDRPWTQCQVAHGRRPHHRGGRLHIGDAALLCGQHHRRFDSGWWDIHIEGSQVRFTRRAVKRDVPAAWDAMLGELWDDPPGPPVEDVRAGPAPSDGGSTVPPTAAESRGSLGSAGSVRSPGSVGSPGSFGPPGSTGPPGATGPPDPADSRSRADRPIGSRRGDRDPSSEGQFELPLDDDGAAS